VFPTEIDAIYREFIARYGTMDLQKMSVQAAKPLTNPFLEWAAHGLRSCPAHARRPSAIRTLRQTRAARS
jgi:hypothetical protein